MLFIKRSIFTSFVLSVGFLSAPAFAETKDVAKSSVKEAVASTTPAKTDNTAKADNKQQMSDKAMDQMLYDVCLREMVAGAKDGFKKSKVKDVENEKLLADIETMAKQICVCAAPKVRVSVIEAMDMAEDKADKYIEDKTKEAMKSCM